MTTCLTPTKTARYKTKLSKKTIETLLNKLFVLDGQEQNKTASDENATDDDIMIT